MFCVDLYSDASKRKGSKLTLRAFNSRHPIKIRKPTQPLKLTTVSVIWQGRKREKSFFENYSMQAMLQDFLCLPKLLARAGLLL